MEHFVICDDDDTVRVADPAPPAVLQWIIPPALDMGDCQIARNHVRNIRVLVRSTVPSMASSTVHLSLRVEAEDSEQVRSYLFTQ